MKPAWKELLYAINGAFLFLLIILATELALGHKAEKMRNTLEGSDSSSIRLSIGNSVDDGLQ